MTVLEQLNTALAEATAARVAAAGRQRSGANTDQALSNSTLDQDIETALKLIVKQPLDAAPPHQVSEERPQTRDHEDLRGEVAGL